jgi:hypothetical protein
VAHVSCIRHRAGAASRSFLDESIASAGNFVDEDRREDL